MYRGHAKHGSEFSSFGSNFLPPLSVQETALLHVQFLKQGVLDATKFEAVIETMATNQIVMSNIVKNSVCQGVVLLSAAIFKPLLGSFDYSNKLSILFHVLWLYPLVIASVLYAGLLKVPEPGEKSRPATSTYRGMTATVATESYKALVLANYFICVVVLRYIPFIGPPFAFIYACIVDSYYCFEAQWLKQGWGLEERVRAIETHWAFFIGFGFPITLISWWSSDHVINLALFSLFFPFFRLMSSSAIPQPLDPNTPASAMSLSFLPKSQASFSMAAAEGGDESKGRPGHSNIPKRIRVLWMADFLYAKVVDALAGGSGGKKKEAGFGHGASYRNGFGTQSQGYGQSPAYGGQPHAYGVQGYGGAYNNEPYGEPQYGQQNPLGQLGQEKTSYNQPGYESQYGDSHQQPGYESQYGSNQPEFESQYGSAEPAFDSQHDHIPQAGYAPNSSVYMGSDQGMAYNRAGHASTVGPARRGFTAQEPIPVPPPPKSSAAFMSSNSPNTTGFVDKNLDTLINQTTRRKKD